MAGEHQPSKRPQWRRTLVSLQQAGIIASVREDECGLPWLYVESANEGSRSYSRLRQTMTWVRATRWPVYAVAGTLPSGAAMGLVMSDRGHLVEAVLGPGFWVAFLPKWADPSGILFFDAAGHMIGQDLCHQPPGQLSWRSRLGVTLYGWATRLRFVRIPRGEYTYGPGARQRG